MVSVVSNLNTLCDRTTEELKEEVLNLVHDGDTNPLKQKVEFHKEVLTPYFDELSRRNPYPVVEDQIPVVLGVWTPIWSTIPFHDSLPGRVHDQSYQVFRDNGYYANMARYAPGNDFMLLRKLSSLLVAYDFMVMQKFEVRNNQWCIQNVGIEQALRRRDVPLSIDRADDWFTQVLDVKMKEFAEKQAPKELKLENLDRNTVKKFEKTYLATPQLEHIYVDRTLRLVKTQRDSKQRPSYTIAVRRK